MGYAVNGGAIISITSITQNRAGGAVTITAVSSLAPPVYFFWYLDGGYVGFNTSGVKSFALSGQSKVDVLDSNNISFDPIANAPDSYPAKRLLVFSRSIDATVSRYRIEQQENGGAWDYVGYIQHDGARWSYQFLTQRLNDLSVYAWRVTPLDRVGNAGTPVVINQELIVRTPDAPNFSVSLEVNGSATFAEAL